MSVVNTFLLFASLFTHTSSNTECVCVCVFQGGRHVDYVVDQIVAKLIEVVKKKNKAGVSVKPFQVGLRVQHLFLKVVSLCMCVEN